MRATEKQHNERKREMRENALRAMLKTVYRGHTADIHIRPRYAMFGDEYYLKARMEG